MHRTRTTTYITRAHTAGSESQVLAVADTCLSLLGKGANGIVVLVRYDEELCALKCGFNQGHAAAFEQEATVMARLGGAGGAPIPLAFCRDTPALLMTCCGSLNLADQEDLGDRVFLQIGLRVVQALQEVHLKDVVHCDLKPDNVTLQLGEDGQLESLHIIDYGFARLAGGCHPRRNSQDPKPWYCHCFYNGTPMRKECDVQGLGFILEFLEEALTFVSPDFDELIQKAFDPRHEERPTLQEAEALLSSLLAGLSEDDAEPSAAQGS
ncbi:casein kinase I-like [Penaeus chinensis]|uniref:casein kinase I-like n=1 Tax=Penaeus chinensis TaxID=139456 RepID=UPI001FB5C46C|nr:casein kinase I-like [Penaeus chinensis]